VNQQQLTEQVYVEPTLEESTPCIDVQGYFGGASIPEPQPLLERSYKVATITMQSGDTEIVNPWELLLGNTQIQSLLKRYTFMRADMRVTLQISCPITTYGVFFATPIYNMDINVINNRGLTWKHLMCAPDATLIDITAREMVEIVIPYVCPFDLMPIRYLRVVPDNDHFTPHNSLYLHTEELKSLLPDLVNPYFHLQVWANFENVTLAGPTMAEGQMNPKRAHKMFSDVSNTLGVLGGVMNKYVIPGSSELLEAAGYAGAAADVANDVNTVMRSVQEVTSSVGVNNEAEPYRIAPWGDLVSSTYTQSQQFMGAVKVQSLPDVPLEGPSQGFNLYDMCKLQCFRHLETHVANDSVDLNMYPAYMTGWYPTILDLFRRARGSLKVHVRFITSPLVTGRVELKVRYDKTEPFVEAGDTYTEVISIQGTVDHFFTIPYLNFSHWTYKTENNIGGEASLVYSKYHPVPQLDILISELTSTTQPASDPSVVVLVMCSAADDLVMQYPQSPFMSITQPVDVAEGQMNLSTLHSRGSFPSITGSLPPVVDSRDVTTVMELLNRYSLTDGKFFAVDNFVDISFLNPSAGTTSTTGTFDWLCAVMCRFTSGSKRFKVEMSADQEDLVYLNTWTSSYKGDVSKDIRYRPFDGITRTYNGVWQILEFEVPYDYPYTMQPVHEDLLSFDSVNVLATKCCPRGGVVDPTIVTSPNSVVRALVAAGHDFQMHVMAPPPLKILVVLTEGL